MTEPQLTVIPGEGDDITAPGPDHPAWRGLTHHHHQGEPVTDSTDYAVRVGERLRMVRELAGLSLDDIQAKTGGRWSDSTIGSWERGERHPFVQVLAEYAGFLGVPVLALLPDSPAADAALARFGADVTRRRMRELARSLEGAPA